ncbi:MAG: M23 family metallopeptidase [Phycisphaerae bacterium]
MFRNYCFRALAIPLLVCCGCRPMDPEPATSGKTFRLLLRIPASAIAGDISGPVEWRILLDGFLAENVEVPIPADSEAGDFAAVEGVVTVSATTEQLHSTVGGQIQFGVKFAGFETTQLFQIPDGDGEYWVVFTYQRPGAVPESQYSYRIPYEDGTKVRVTGDDLTHPNAPGRYDMVGIPTGQPHNLVAARDGRIEAIVDSNAEPTDVNNYVWISHGFFSDDDPPQWQIVEMTKYSHPLQNSVPSHLAVGDMVQAGDIIGVEGDVGLAGGVHLHFEVAVPTDPANPIDPDGFIIGENRTPRICSLMKLVAGGSPGVVYALQPNSPTWFIDHATVAGEDHYVAASCEDE